VQGYRWRVGADPTIPELQRLSPQALGSKISAGVYGIYGRYQAETNVQDFPIFIAV
jgi:hypothetical protein